MEFLITVRGRQAQAADAQQFVVCGNSKDRVRFDLDAEWDAFPQKTARFRWLRNGAEIYADVPFSGDFCRMPAVSQTAQVEIGLYAGAICTSAPARFPCMNSITDIPAQPAPEQDDYYNALMELLRKGGLFHA